MMQKKMVKEYDELLKTFRRMFEMVDAIHFNSQNTADVFGLYVDVPKKSAVVSITHSGVSDHREQRKYDQSVLKLGFIGSEAPYKGLPLLKRVIARLNKEGKSEKVVLNVYGGRTGVDEKLGNVSYCGRFGASQMSAVYDSMDLLVVPSIWNETFGFTVIEAMQYGVPALVSSKVGAKDIVMKYAPRFVYTGEKELYDILYELISDRTMLINYNEKIVGSPWEMSMKKNSDDIVNLYKSLL